MNVFKLFPETLAKKLAAFRPKNQAVPADKAFWDNAGSPIMIYPQSVIFRGRKLVRLASLIGRLYRQ